MLARDPSFLDERRADANLIAMHSAGMVAHLDPVGAGFATRAWCVREATHDTRIRHSFRFLIACVAEGHSLDLVLRAFESAARWKAHSFDATVTVIDAVASPNYVIADVMGRAI